VGAPAAVATSPAAEVAAVQSGASAPSTGSARTFRIVPAESEASYEVQEKFARLPAPSKAVGRTSSIEGDFRLATGEAATLLANRFAVDLRTLKSDSDRRDQLIREQWLESNRFPMAEFTATRVEQLPAAVVEGQEVPLRIIGDMKIRDVTREVAFDTRAMLQGSTLSGTATTFLLMRDFGFEPPSILNIVTVEDGVNLSVRFTATEE
jgi:polyisoprenoid-binding protein YceI